MTLPMRCQSLARAMCVAIVSLSATMVQANPLDSGWALNGDSSHFWFQSIKNTTKVEVSSFASLRGQIAPDGAVEVGVLLDSVDTKVDIRNVRMRFLFFETFNHPEAVISARVDTGMLDTLAETRRMAVPMPFTLSLHGVEKAYETEIVATLIDDDTVSVASTAPVSIPVADFGLMENLGKLEEAAGGITIVPSATVTFDFVFSRNGGPTNGSNPPADITQSPVAEAAPDSGGPEKVTSASVALEAEGDFSVEACIGRFQTFSGTGDIVFSSNSDRLEPSSFGLLATLKDVVTRCPDLTIEIAGHTDSDGREGWNQTLSEMRAAAVRTHLIEAGIDGSRLIARGYGETRPLVPNVSRENKARNRRIEISVVQ